MAEIRPFRALRFTDAAGRLQELTCPPYDIISESQRLSYLKRNPHNIIRLELPRDGEDPYAAAGNVLGEWLRDGILRKDDQPALYIYEIEFDLEGRSDISTADSGRRSVAGLIAQVHLEEFSKGIVLPHEETLSKAKTDRLNLMKATGCNFSDRDNVDGQHHACADVGKLGDDVVLDEVGVVPQEDHSAVAVAHAEEVPPRLKAIGADIVLEVVSLARHVLRVEVEIRFLLRAKEVVDQLQLFCGVHFLAAGAEPRKISGKLAADAVEIVTRLLNVVLVRAYG